MAIINLDIDGVLFDFVSAFREHLIDNHRFKSNELPAPTTYYFAAQWGMSEQLFSSFFGDFEHEDYYQKSCFNLITDACKGQLQNIFDNHHLNLVTARSTVRGADALQSYAARKSTIEWLMMNSIPHHGLFFTNKKTNVRGDILIDDCPSHLEEAAAAGMRAICFDQPWNQDWAGERVKSLKEVQA